HLRGVDVAVADFQGVADHALRHLAVQPPRAEAERRNAHAVGLHMNHAAVLPLPAPRPRGRIARSGANMVEPAHRVEAPLRRAGPACALTPGVRSVTRGAAAPAQRLSWRQMPRQIAGSLARGSSRPARPARTSRTKSSASS